MLKNISLLGNLYDFDSSHLDDLMYFQRLLDTIQPKSNISFKVNALLRNVCNVVLNVTSYLYRFVLCSCIHHVKNY